MSETPLTWGEFLTLVVVGFLIVLFFVLAEPDDAYYDDPPECDRAAYEACH